VESCFGLGESLVSGLVNADSYKVQDRRIVAKRVATKPQAIVAVEGGGTQDQPIDPAQQRQPALSDSQVVKLVQLGRLIEEHFGRPQDIEWCLVDDGFQFVQARPITTLFPIPEVADQGNHVYLSVGHQQMMTDPMKPLGLSVWKLTSPAPMHEAGGRLFVDATPRLASPASRARLLDMVGRTDPLTRNALEMILERRDFVPSFPDEDPGAAPAVDPPSPIEIDSTIVTDLIGRSQESIAALRGDIRTKSGSELFDFILADIGELRRVLFDPVSHQVWMGAMESTWWLNERLQTWLGEKNAADALTQSVPHNVTSEMGLALLDVADVIRPYPDVVTFLGQVEDEGFLDELPTLAGGREARDAIRAFLDKYGMRCAGEIDITKPRWSEQPTALVPIILGNVSHFAPGAGGRRFEHGRQEAWDKEQELLERLRALPSGEQKAEEVKQMIDRVRNFIGYREYPKYSMVCRYFVYKQALLVEAEGLVQARLLREKEDIFYLTFQELHEVVRTNQVDNQLIQQRKDAFCSFQNLRPPRVLTSDGEAISGAYRRHDLPAGALAGLPASAGTIEGRARVVLDMAKADLEADDILVTAYTDPSWTPLFVAIKGLVTEVGGLMTHGAVIAREYGLPAVVAVENATGLIQDGQRIRVHGTDGYVEILS
jgi:pyruvate,water dikinase